jgi:hypothetical protein
MDMKTELKTWKSWKDCAEKLEAANAALEAEVERLKEFLGQLDMCELRGESLLILKPVGEIYKDIKPKPTLGDSVILMTCAAHSTPELFLKMVKTVMSSKP